MVGAEQPVMPSYWVMATNPDNGCDKNNGLKRHVLRSTTLRVRGMSGIVDIAR